MRKRPSDLDICRNDTLNEPTRAPGTNRTPKGRSNSERDDATLSPNEIEAGRLPTHVDVLRTVRFGARLIS